MERWRGKWDGEIGDGKEQENVWCWHFKKDRGDFSRREGAVIILSSLWGVFCFLALSNPNGYYRTEAGYRTCNGDEFTLHMSG